jgi:hypothetical protein
MTTEGTARQRPNRQVIVTRAEGQGWDVEVTEDRDNRVVKRVRCTDWHRVERALARNQVGQDPVGPEF